MGYNTQFKGRLNFVNEINQEQLDKLDSILGEDCRQHPEWGYQTYTWIDLKLTKDNKGLEWDGAEKTYDLTEKVNIIIELMKRSFPEFELNGRLLAHEDSVGDIWVLDVDKNKAKEYPIEESDIEHLVNIKKQDENQNN